MMGLGKLHQPADFKVSIFSRCRNIKRKPPIWDAPLAQKHANFFSGCNFMMGLEKLKLYTKFEVASFSRCKNIKRELQKFWGAPWPIVTPNFFLGIILWWALANPSCIPNLKSLVSAVAEILKGNRKFWGAPLD